MMADFAPPVYNADALYSGGPDEIRTRVQNISNSMITYAIVT